MKVRIPSDLYYLWAWNQYIVEFILMIFVFEKIRLSNIWHPLYGKWIKTHLIIEYWV
jgi:hypothetical protein